MSGRAHPRRRGRRGAVGAGAVLLAVLVAVLGLGAPAQAHASLVGSDPVDGSTLRSAPERVVLRFDEAVRLVPGSARVLDAKGAPVNRADAAAAIGSRVRIPLPHLGRGAYLVAWTVISADGHEVAGSLRFGVGVPAARATNAGTDSVQASANRWHGALAGLGNAAVVLLLGIPLGGLVLRRRLLDRPALRVTAAAGIGLDLVVSLAQLHVDAARAAGHGVLGGPPIGDLGDHGQQMLVLRVAALVLLALGGTWWVRGGFAARDRLTRGPLDALTLAAAAVVLSHAWTGHAATGSWQLAAVLAGALHIVAAATWIGGLLVLLIAPPTVVPRAWSIAAGTCVATLVATGLIQALRQVTPFAALWTTQYGALLLVKAALLVGTVGVAQGARRALRRAARPGTPTPLLRRWVGTEVGALVIVLAVTGVLQADPPARDVYGPAVTLSAPLGDDTVRIEVDRTRRGPLVIRLERRHGGSVAPVRVVQGRLTPVGGPSGTALTLTVGFRRGPGGVWISRDADAPFPGTWRLALDVEVDRDVGYATAATFRVW